MISDKKVQVYNGKKRHERILNKIDITPRKESTLKKGGFKNIKPNGLKKLRTIGLLE